MSANTGLRMRSMHDCGVITPSDLTRGKGDWAAGAVTVRQMTDEERLKYGPPNPIKQEPKTLNLVSRALRRTLQEAFADLEAWGLREAERLARDYGLTVTQIAAEHRFWLQQSTAQAATTPDNEQPTTAPETTGNEEGTMVGNHKREWPDHEALMKLVEEEKRTTGPEYARSLAERLGVGHSELVARVAYARKALGIAEKGKPRKPALVVEQPATGAAGPVDTAEHGESMPKETGRLTEEELLSVMGHGDQEWELADDTRWYQIGETKLGLNEVSDDLCAHCLKEDVCVFATIEREKVEPLLSFGRQGNVRIRFGRRPVIECSAHRATG